MLQEFLTSGRRRPEPFSYGSVGVDPALLFLPPLTTPPTDVGGDATMPPRDEPDGEVVLGADPAQLQLQQQQQQQQQHLPKPPALRKSRFYRANMRPKPTPPSQRFTPRPKQQQQQQRQRLSDKS